MYIVISLFGCLYVVIIVHQKEKCEEVIENIWCSHNNNIRTSALKKIYIYFIHNLEE